MLKYRETLHSTVDTNGDWEVGDIRNNCRCKAKAFLCFALDHLELTVL